MPKFSKGDYVVHPGQGVCIVEGILPGAPFGENDGTSSHPKALYELYPISGPRMRICFPVEQESTLRETISPREAKKCIASMPDLEDDPFSDRSSRAMEEHFMLSLRTGDCADTVRVLKTMYGRLHAALPRGKRAPACYGRIFKAARERVACELGVALGVDPGRVDGLIEASFRA